MDKVDADFIKLNITPDPSSANKFLVGLRFLGLVRDDGTATESMVKLRLTGEGFTKNLGEIVRESYKELLDTISVKDARLEDVVNYFVEKYEYSGDAANRATAVFAHLAQEGGIEISEQLSSRKSPQPKAKPQANQVRKDKGRATNDEERQQSTQSMPVTPSGVDLLQMGDVKIYLPKENPSAVEIARSLLDVYVRTKKE